MAQVLRYTAFSDVPGGGNPAGIVLDAAGMSDDEMQAVAADVGYSETAFLVQSEGAMGAPGVFDVRYFSPKAEVPFCGHATIASAVALHDHGVPGPLTFRTASGEVPVLVREVEGAPMATLTSVVPEVRALPIEQLDELLACFGWQMGDLDLGLPARLAYAGAWHPVLPLAEHRLLHELSYDFDRLLALMGARSWTTVQAVWREEPTVFHARDPFPVGGVVEDPATGAAAAALGAYLVDVGAVHPPEVLTVHQGADMGRPSLLKVELLPGDPRVHVTGSAVPLADR
jgi:PhzF family phenazine biosynthesis protein